MSPGGYVTEGSAILNTMNACGCDFRINVLGNTVSMAIVIASFGTTGNRFIGSNSGMMIHQALGGFSGQTADILRIARHIKKINNCIYEILAANTGVSIEKIAVDCDRDYHLNTN